MSEESPTLPEKENTIVVRNEFTEVYVKKVHTGKGERLEVVSPKTGFSIRLDALGLEGLSWQDPETISKFLETPYGPEDHDESH
ncbi:hypothetical protein SAMN05192561_1184 [Halopenitus malekzadehii]|uniref:Dihydrodiol dehydrogenase n=1 Tax=Halopenitus malekzadehii TaxID=1267564 RepID=A0A1H6JTW1_9EURY|nr:hypothetical protein [Halopenitus malekzadehii]SEH64020.1 hypothetical protein SAMN05192561_1184 [Halopenitus malekzadehii]